MATYPIRNGKPPPPRIRLSTRQQGKRRRTKRSRACSMTTRRSTWRSNARILSRPALPRARPCVTVSISRITDREKRKTTSKFDWICSSLTKGRTSAFSRLTRSARPQPRLPEAVPAKLNGKAISSLRLSERLPAGARKCKFPGRD